MERKIALLRTEIEKHRIAYHAYDTPIISDEIYDSLMRELVELETKYPQYDDVLSPSRRVGGDILDSFKKVKHEVAQWSYDNVFDFEELENWEKRNLNYFKKENSSIDENFNFDYFVELKIDGLKVILTYKNGRLLRAASRGDGDVGEDITENIKTIKSIPLTLKDKIDLTVIGECFISKSEFEKINKKRKEENLEEYKNPRNLAAGTLRQLDPKIVAERKLEFFAYDTENLNIDIKKYIEAIKTQKTEIEMIKDLGFKVNTESKFCKNIIDVQRFYDIWNGEKRYNQEYGIDGVVIKINEKSLETALGFTAKAPRGGVAYKLLASEAISTVLSITYQVGRSGAVTPVAELSPVSLDGTTVKRATLHNFEEIERLGLRIGDKVMVRKAGDIIPQIFDVLINLRSGNEKEISEIKNCPECKSVLFKDTESGGVKIFCKNKLCPAKVIGKIIYFVSKKCMNIDGLGESTIETFFKENLIKNISDIYTLTEKSKIEKILSLEGFKQKSVDNLVDSINKSKNVNLDTFITALGINSVGAETAILVAQKFKNVSNIIKAQFIDFVSIYGLGEKTSQEIINYFANIENKKEVEKLMLYLNIKDFVEDKTFKKLTNMVFVITGTFEKMTRAEIENKIKENGGKVGSDISKSTSYLIAGEAAGSKLEKSKKLNVKTLSLDEFLQLI